MISWLAEELKLFFVWILYELLDGIANLIDSIPVPDFLIAVHSFTLPDDILYFSTLFQVPAGIAIMVSAYILRFLIRRIPLIG